MFLTKFCQYIEECTKYIYENFNDVMLWRHEPLANCVRGCKGSFLRHELIRKRQFFLDCYDTIKSGIHSAFQEYYQCINQNSFLFLVERNKVWLMLDRFVLKSPDLAVLSAS